MLLSLTLKNFKKHAHLHVDFTAGLNGIYGPNYRGKSTILYGVLFALGGAPQVPGTRLARRDSDGKFSVEMSFRMMAGVYRVVRTKSTANLYQQGEDAPLATGTTAVNDKIEELIGMSVKQWKELHYAKQKNAHSLLRYSANNLQQLIRRLVGAEELDQVQARLKRMADKEGGIVDALAQVAHTEEQCQAEIDEANRVLALAKGSLTEVEEEISNLEAMEKTGLEAIQKASDRVAVLQEQKGAADTARVRLAAAQRGLQEAKEAAHEREADLTTANARVDEAKEGYDPAAGEKIAQFESLKLKRAAAERQLEERTSRRDAAEVKLAQAKQAKLQAEANLASARGAAGDDLDGFIADLDDQVQAAVQADVLAVQKTKDLKAAVDGAACPTCNRPFEEHDPAKLEAELEEAMAASLAAANVTLELKGKRRQAELQRNTLNDYIAADTRAADEVKRAEEAVLACQGDFNDALDVMTGIEGEENDLGLTDQIVTALRSQSQKMATANQALAQAQAENDRAQRAVTAAADALHALQAKGEPEDPELIGLQIEKVAAQLKKDRATLAELREALASARTRHGSVLADQSNAATQLNRWTNALEQLKQNSDRRATAEKRLAKIKHLQKHLKENAEGYMGKVWASFLQQASQFVAQCTGGDIEGLQRTDDGAFVFLEEGQEMQLEEASGAQEAIIGLAVQVSLSGAAPCHLNTVLLDEPTADMDPDCSLATMVAMKALGVQVIFVSHHQTDNTLCDNAITL